jgi:hypothetical protein
LKSRIFITAGERSVACGNNAKLFAARRAELYTQLQGAAFQVDFKIAYFRRSLTCGYENWAFQALNS